MQEKTYKVGRGGDRHSHRPFATATVRLGLPFDPGLSLQAIKGSFNLTDAQAGMLPSLLQVGVAVFLIPAAVLADRFARRKVIMVMSLIWSAFTSQQALQGNWGTCWWPGSWWAQAKQAINRPGKPGLVLLFLKRSGHG